MNAPIESAVAEAAKAASAIDLARIDLKDVALAQFGTWRDALEKATQHFTTLVVEMPTQAKVDEYTSMRQRWINTPLAKARATSKALKSKLTSVSKDVGAELETIEAAWAVVDQLITPQIDARQAELDAEREAKAQAEAARKQAHLDKIAGIRAYLGHAQGLPSERISNGIGLVEAMAFGDDCEEFLAQYEAAKAETLEAMRRLLANVKAREDAEAQRLENERIAADLERHRRELAAQAAEIARQKAEQEAAELRRRVAETHAIVLTFPEPEAPPAAVPVETPAPAQEAAPAASLTPEQAWPLPSDPEPGPAAPEAPAAEPVLLSTGAINARYGWTMTADFIKARGISPKDNPKAKTGTYFDQADLPKLDAALIDYIRSLSA